LIADGELTGYRMGRSRRTIRVDLNEVDEQPRKQASSAGVRVAAAQFCAPNPSRGAVVFGAGGDYWDLSTRAERSAWAVRVGWT